ncbi:MAG TPA: hypothetical protein PL124_09625 [Candidatus Cloacimonadota bacterium]|nr:hypothetical protein [Candidatus Cloacimonadota bacterium]
MKNLSSEDREYLIQAMRNDYALFATTCMGHIVEDMPPYQREMYDSFSKNYKMSAYPIFRGSAKSTISKPIQTSHDLCYGKYPYTMLISESEDQASADLISIQDELFNNESILEIYGNLRGAITNTESMELINGCYVRIKGVKGRARGYKWKNNRPSMIILDDFESEHNTETEVMRAAVHSWVYRVIKFMGKAGDTRVQFFNTIVHPGSFMAKAKKSPFFKPPYGFYMEIPVMYKNEAGEWVSNWEKQFPIRELLADRKRFYEINEGPSWDQEMLNIPAVTGKTSFKVDMLLPLDGAIFQRYRNVTWIEKGGKKIPVRVYMGFDPAASVKEFTDDTCGVVIGIPPIISSRDGLFDVIILDIVIGKYEPSQQPDILFSAKERFSFIHATVETQGYQLALPSFCRQMIANGRQPAFSIVEFTSQVSKNNKFLNGLEPYLNGGHISYMPGIKHIDTLKQQLQDFNSGNTRTKDDLVDALYLSLNKAFPSPRIDIDEILKTLKNEKPKAPALNWRTI